MRLTIKYALVAIIGWPPMLASATILHVPEYYNTIQAALDSCASGDTVLVAPGHYHERLEVPNRAITLGSQTLLTSDTLFIPLTIIDGDSLGTVITSNVGGLNQFILNGFTIQHGLGYMFHGGGIHFADSTDAILQNLHLTMNYSEFGGSAVYGSGPNAVSYRGPRRIILDHIRLFNNHIESSSEYSIVIQSNHYAKLKDFICNDATNGVMRFSSRDSILIDNYHVSNGNFRYGSALVSGMRAHTQNSYQKYDNISVNSCSFEQGILVNIGGYRKCVIKNFSFANNRQVANRTSACQLLYLDINNAEFQADSLIFRHNSGLIRNSSVGLFGISGNTSRNVISNLIVDSCSLGDSSYTPWTGTNMPTMLDVSECSIEHAKFSNNRITLTPGTNPSEAGVFGANILRTQNFYDDSVRYHDIRFENNMVIDLDDYNSLPVHSANLGQCMIINSSGYLCFVMDSCYFVDNRQPNMAPEVSYTGYFDDRSDIASIVNIQRPDMGLEPGNEKLFSDLVFRDNDDGGIRSYGSQNLRFRNVQMINVSRQAFKLESNSFALENVMIDGCTPFAPIHARSEQMPLWLQCNEPSTVTNCTIVNSTTPYVVMAGTTPYQGVSDPIVTFENCIFWNNQYDRFEALVPNYSPYPEWNSYRPGRFNHCLLPETPEYGDNNLIDMNPHFDEEWGLPYLSSDSPCLDMGNPDSAWNDLEDSTQPGFALWPSQGGLRNDIGFTGGPWAQPFDTNWVALPRWEPRLEPANFTLGIPWPNPFNPVTQIPLELARPSLVRLTVHNVLGQQVAVLCNGLLPAGRRIFCWDAAGQGSGLYFVTLQVDVDRMATRAVTLLR